MKICPVRADLFHVDGQMDRWTDGRQANMTKLIGTLNKYRWITLTAVYHSSLPLIPIA